jgi:hypothetical protein
MHAYLMTGFVQRSQLRPVNSRGRTYQDYQTWGSCDTLIVLGESLVEAQKEFEASLCPQTDDQTVECEIKKVISAQFIPELFTEAGPAPLDWSAISNQAFSTLQALPADDFEQGYWVDIAQAVPPEPLSGSIDDLQRTLPEDISTGLNWSPDKQFFFVLSLLTPPPEFPVEQMNAPETENVAYEEAKQKAIEYYRFVTENPQAADKQAAALIQARNSVVAAWLWRRNVAGQQLAALPIRLDPWCIVLGSPLSSSAEDSGA